MSGAVHHLIREKFPDETLYTCTNFYSSDNFYLSVAQKKVTDSHSSFMISGLLSVHTTSMIKNPSFQYLKYIGLFSVLNDGCYFRGRAVLSEQKIKLIMLVDNGEFLNYEELKERLQFYVIPASLKFRPVAFHCRLAGMRSDSKIKGENLSALFTDGSLFIIEKIDQCCQLCMPFSLECPRNVKHCGNNVLMQKLTLKYSALGFQVESKDVRYLLQELDLQTKDLGRPRTEEIVLQWNTLPRLKQSSFEAIVTFIDLDFTVYYILVSDFEVTK